MLAGDSVHFDRRFLAHHMPAVIPMLHYRQIDVSSIREARKAADLFVPTKARGHRALEDIAESIAHYRMYLDSMRVDV